MKKSNIALTQEVAQLKEQLAAQVERENCIKQISWEMTKAYQEEISRLNEALEKCEVNEKSEEIQKLRMEENGLVVENAELKEELNTTLQNQLSGNWKFLNSDVSPRYVQPEKFEYWTSRTLNYKLTEDTFVSKLLGGATILDTMTTLGASENGSCTIIENNRLLTIEEDKTLIWRYVEDGMLKIDVEGDFGSATYTFEKVE